MLNRTKSCFTLKPKRLAADTAYGTGKFLDWLIKDKNITPHIPEWEKGDRAYDIFARSDFRWDRRRCVYICPNGKQLRTSGTVHDGRMLLYRASKRDSDACPLRTKCGTREEARKIPRDFSEDARDVARAKMKAIVPQIARPGQGRDALRSLEDPLPLFARLRLRGLSGARDEFHLAAIVQNLKTLALCLIWSPAQPACA